jgi:type IV secretory pathway protease TraF
MGLGDLVVVRPPVRLAAFLDRGGYLPVSVPLLKRIAALPGQCVCRTGGIVSIDGRNVARALKKDRRGRPLPIWSGCFVLDRGSVFLLNRNRPDSLDGRYFGALPSSAVVARAIPVWTEGDQQ